MQFFEQKFIEISFITKELEINLNEQFHSVRFEVIHTTVNQYK